MASGKRSTSQYDYLLKLLMIGDSGVGKTCLLLSFTTDEFDSDSRSTIGVDLKVKIMNVKNQKVKLTIWDTAGQEQFRTLTSAYYRGAHGVVLVYDVTRAETFRNIREWLKEVEIFSTKENVVKALVGNKIDLSAREVEREEGRQFAEDHGMLFFESSAKTQEGVQQAFQELVFKILDNPALLEDNRAQRNFTVTSSPAEDGGCC